ERALSGALPFTVCDEKTCLPATEVPVAAKLTIEAGAPRPEFSGSATPAPDVAAAAPKSGATPRAGALDMGLLLLPMTCFGGGVVALAMPCTYPMIPITFSFFTKRAEQRHGKVLPLALTYGFGIVAMFVVVGVALSAVIVDIVNYWLTNAVIFVAFV